METFGGGRHWHSKGRVAVLIQSHHLAGRAVQKGKAQAFSHFSKGDGIARSVIEGAIGILSEESNRSSVEADIEAA